MPNLTFYHPGIIPSSDGKRPGPYLNIATGFDDVSWAYALNTATYPTYGGEVVQILSCFIDDLEITGTLSSYLAMERVYAYFAYYMQIASQGRSRTPEPGTTSFNQQPMIMTYPERGWSFKLIITQAPQFQYGREIIAPPYRLVAHIVDDSENLNDIKEFTQSKALERFLTTDKEAFDLEGRIGFKAENPFSAPGTIFGDNFDPNNTREQWRQTSDRYNEVIEAYLDADLSALYETQASRPNSTPLQDAQSAQSVKQGLKIADRNSGG